MCDLFPIGPFNQHLRVRCYVPLFHISMVRLSSHSGIPGILSWEVQEVLEDPSVPVSLCPNFVHVSILLNHGQELEGRTRRG